MVKSKGALRPEENKGFIADVVIVGAGPAGAVAAKICAQRGMHTLLLEKEKLPPHKPSIGVLISYMVRAIIVREFGPIPEEVLTDPPKILGYAWHTARFGDEPLDCGAGFLNTWREDLDYWMVQKAKQAGADVWEETLVTNVIQESDGIIVKVRRLEEEKEIRARFVIGADGGNSSVRKKLYPNIDFPLFAAFEECHPGSLDVDKRYLHEFGTSCIAPSRYHVGVLHKTRRHTNEDCFILCGGSYYVTETGRPAMSPKEAMSRGKQFLAEKYGFNPDSEPLFTAGFAVTDLREELWTGRLLPAKGNILLVGDAAGVVTGGERHGGEGMNMALKSGVLAASAIIKAADTSREAAYIYLTALQPTIDVIRTIAANVIFYQTNWLEREKLLNQLI